jgi:hypothetical protein
VTPKQFAKQIERLTKVFGAKYPQERTALFWRAFQHVMDNVFEDAVDELIANCRSAPMMKELDAAVIKAKGRDHEQRKMSQLQSANPIALLTGGTKREFMPEFMGECYDLLEKLKTRQITMKQFEEGCDLLDQVAAGLGEKSCHRCNGSGYLNQNNALYRCTCPRGREHPEDISSTRPGGEVLSAKIPYARI